MTPLPALTPGVVFARDFRIVRPLSVGGMGAVYVVEQISTQRPRALKIMLPSLVQDARMRERFAQEASVSARIRSDHVVEVVAAGIDESTQTPWLVMELLEGEDLSVRLERVGRLPVHTTLEILRQMCHGLGAAHTVGLVHRDMKPANIFLASPRREGIEFVVKILDFGIAKVVDESRTMAQATAAMGSPLWMAPEQGDQGQVRPAADVWALGLIAFVMLTGKYYWRAANTESVTIASIMREVYIDPIESASARAQSLGAQGTLPNGFDGWFARCVVRESKLRFQDANEAINALTPILSGQSTAGGFAKLPSATVGLSFPPLPMATPMAPMAPVYPVQPSGFTTPPSGPGFYPNTPMAYPSAGHTQAWNATPTSGPQTQFSDPKRASGGLPTGLIVVLAVGLFLGVGIMASAYMVLSSSNHGGPAIARGPVVIIPGVQTPPTTFRYTPPLCSAHNTSTNIPGLTGVAQIAAGKFHSCALLTDRTLRCWGWNVSRQIGDGTTEDQESPTVVRGMTEAAQVAPGQMETCALRADGTVWCWGMSMRGARPTPTQVDGIVSATSITHGDMFACARRSDGTVWCWGQNSEGQLGDGSTTTRTSAVGVPGLTGVSQVAAGASHTCALTTDGSVWCWGCQEHGQLGDGRHPREGRPFPAMVPGLSGATEIAAGEHHTCARMRDNTLRCWGANDQGQLGTGNTTASHVPVAVPGLTDVATFSLGNSHTCALKRDGSAWCWGANYLCALGAFPLTGNTSPQRVTALGPLMGISAGGMHTCARRADGTARCWGYNRWGALGNGTTAEQAELDH